MESVLNIAAGKIKPLYMNSMDESYFLIQLDQMYKSFDTIELAETKHEHLLDVRQNEDITIKVNEDAFDFLANYSYQFDHIASYRFLEHISKPHVQGFIYLLSTALKIGGTLDIIVPNYEILANMILKEDISDNMKHKDWEQHDTELTYELLNEPSMPHASIWTPQRIKYFFELEERFKVDSLDDRFLFDGRDCYIRSLMTRVK